MDREPPLIICIVCRPVSRCALDVNMIYADNAKILSSLIVGAYKDPHGVFELNISDMPTQNLDEIRDMTLRY